MASVQDHGPVIKELSDKRQQDSQPIQPSQLQGTQQTPSKIRDISDSPRPLTGTSETLQESSPPRFSQLVGTLPEPNPPRRRPSTATNPATLANHPDTASGPSNGTGQMSNVTAGLSGVYHAPTIQDRNQNQFTSAVPDRRLYYDPIRGESATQIYASDDGEHDRRNHQRRMGVPRPRPTFNPAQDGTVSGNRRGSRGSPREDFVPDLFPDPQVPHQPTPKTVADRLLPTVQAAETEQEKYRKRARNQSLLINGAIGLQVVVGAITTGVAAASTNIGSAVAVLGGISTALASYLAKARGSGEPEFSNLRARELSTFLRDVRAFIMDHGDESGAEFDVRIMMYRERFELIIKTEGEDSTSGTGYAANRNHQPGNFPSANQQGMPGMWGGGNSQPAPPQVGGGYGYGQLSEKQQMQWKNEKTLGGAV